MPSLPTASQKSDSIQIGGNAVSGDEEDPLANSRGKWEDEEERRFFEDIQDLKDFVPKSVLGIESDEKEDQEIAEEREKVEKEKADAEAKKLEEELEGLKLDSDRVNGRNDGTTEVEMREEEPDGCVCLSISQFEIAGSLILFSTITPTPTSPTKASSPPLSPQLAPQGPSQLLTALLARLPDATNRTMIDQAAIDFAFLNSKAARKRLIKVSSQACSQSRLTESSVVLGCCSKESNRLASSLCKVCSNFEQIYAGHWRRACGTGELYLSSIRSYVTATF